MAIDVLPLKAFLAARTGDIRVHLGEARLYGDSGTLEFSEVSPTKMVSWKSAEVTGLQNPNSDAVRIRLEGPDGTMYYIDETDGKVKEVGDDTVWDDDYTKPYMLGSLDLWTGTSVTFHVHLVSTELNPDPRITGINVLIDLPTWEGVVATAARQVSSFLFSNAHPVLIHTETLSGYQNQWKIGKPHTESGFQLIELVQCTVNGRHKSASLSNGIVTLEGPSAKANDIVEIAVKYQPTSSVRRVAEVRVVNEVPFWVLTNLAIQGGLVGVAPDLFIGGWNVKERTTELRITVQGVARRTADAFQMRLALQNAFGPGLTIQLPSGRCLFAQLDGLVEVIEQGAEMNLPMCQGIVSVPLSEFVQASLVRTQRATQDHVDADPSLTLGQYLETNLTIHFPEGEFCFSSNESDGFTNESPC